MGDFKKVKPFDEITTLLTENKDLKQMFKDMEKLEKEISALIKRMSDFKINYK